MHGVLILTRTNSYVADELCLRTNYSPFGDIEGAGYFGKRGQTQDLVKRLYYRAMNSPRALHVGFKTHS